MTVVLLVRCGSIPLPCHGHSGRRRMETARNCVGIPRTCDRLNCAPRWSFPPLCRRPSRRFMVCLGRMECPFCAICRGELSASVVLRDEHACAFLDTRPVFKGHVLVVPREHVADLLDLARTEMEPLLSAVQRIAAAMEKGLSADGSFVAINTKISQSVPHLHVHVVPRRKGDGLRGFFWPRTKYESDADREEFARRISDALR